MYKAASTPTMLRCWNQTTAKLRHQKLHTSSALLNVFPESIFVEPLVDLEDLKKPLPADDPRNFLYAKPMLSDQTPVFYRDRTLDRLIRVFQIGGKKELCRSLVLESLELIKRRQYKEWKQVKTEEEKRAIILDPITILNKGIDNCQPVMSLQPVVRGGVTYQVPFPISDLKAEFKAMKFLKEICRKKAFHGAYSLTTILAHELIAAAKNEGATVMMKQEYHKACEANRAFTHYRK